METDHSDQQALPCLVQITSEDDFSKPDDFPFLTNNDELNLFPFYFDEIPQIPELIDPRSGTDPDPFQAMSGERLHCANTTGQHPQDSLSINQSTQLFNFPPLDYPQTGYTLDSNYAGDTFGEDYANYLQYVPSRPQPIPKEGSNTFQEFPPLPSTVFRLDGFESSLWDSTPQPPHSQIKPDSQSDSRILSPGLYTGRYPEPAFASNPSTATKKTRHSKHKITYTCHECHLSKKACTGSPGIICDRCWRNYRRSVPQSPSSNALILPEVLFFHISHTHDLLINLRHQVDEISCLESGKTLERLFDGSLVCLVDDSSSHLSGYTTSSATVTIRRLATTSSARKAASTANVIPALDRSQMENFIKRRCPRELISALPRRNQQIVNRAWKCAYWLSTLFNWNANEIYCDKFTTLGFRLDESTIGLKNLVLELMYSIVYEVEELMKTLFRDVIESLKQQKDQQYDPYATSYALLIVYYAITNSKVIRWDAKELHFLNTFLSGLHKNSKVVLKALEQYRWRAAIRCCGQLNGYQGVFDQLISLSKIPKSTVMFSFEQVPEYISNYNQPTLYRSNYTEILAATVSFFKDDDLFNGRASRIPTMWTNSDQFGHLTSHARSEEWTETKHEITPGLTVGMASHNSNIGIANSNFSSKEILSIHSRKRKLPNSSVTHLNPNKTIQDSDVPSLQNLPVDIIISGIQNKAADEQDELLAELSSLAESDEAVKPKELARQDDEPPSRKRRTLEDQPRKSTLRQLGSRLWDCLGFVF
ncbi:hypothetical protein F4819DRAFT_475983 [Hypoxylon fuscum]|nr:hypothetical protein F4819DRAFT_475983 [Hypoxylon fuscum]